MIIAAGLFGETARIAYLGLEEPPKHEVTAWVAGDPVQRRVRLMLLDMATGAGRDVIVSVGDAAVVGDSDLDPVVDGHPPIILEEFMLVDEIVKADPRWRQAMADRGITDLDMVRPCPLSAGSFGIDGESGRRMLRVLSFLANRREGPLLGAPDRRRRRVHRPDHARGRRADRPRAAADPGRRRATSTTRRTSARPAPR